MASLEQELGDLKLRVEHLEATVGRLTSDERSVSLPASPELQDQTQLLAWLKTQGLIREPTSEERRVAAEWEMLPEEEKKAHLRTMRSLVLNPPLSQVIIENRR